MSSVLEVMKPEIESTIKRLDLKQFEPDPIAGAALFENHQRDELRLQAAWVYS